MNKERVKKVGDIPRQLYRCKNDRECSILHEDPAGCYMILESTLPSIKNVYVSYGCLLLHNWRLCFRPMITLCQWVCIGLLVYTFLNGKTWFFTFRHFPVFDIFYVRPMLKVWLIVLLINIDVRILRRVLSINTIHPHFFIFAFIFDRGLTGGLFFTWSHLTSSLVMMVLHMIGL